MAKSINKTPIKIDKSVKESSDLFHNIMQASVKGNPKPKEKQTSKKK